MAHITLAGVLLDPTGEFSVGDKVRFTHQSTTGNTMKSAVSVLKVPPNGAYSIDLEYGLVLVEYNDYRLGQYRNLGIATVNATNTATSIPELLNAVVPVSSAELIQFQTIQSNCVAAQNAAAASAAAALVSQNAAAASAATLDLINDLSQAYIFDTVAAYQVSTTVFPVGKTIHLDDRQADFTVISGTGTGNDANVIASTPASQSISLIKRLPLNPVSYGVNPASADNSSIWQLILDDADVTHVHFSNIGVYTFLSATNSTRNINITFAVGAEIDCTNAGYTGGYWTEFLGALPQIESLGVNASKGERQVTFASPPSLVAKDVFIIWNPTDFSFSGFRSNYYAGEFCKVVKVVGSVVTVAANLYESYAFGDVNIYRLDGITVGLGNVKINGDASDSLISIKYGKDCYLKGLRSDHKNNSAISLTTCYNTLIENPTIHNEGDGGDDYGIAWTNSQTGRVIGGDIYSRRHAITTGGGAGAGSVPCRDLKFIGSTLSNDIDSQVFTADFHGNTEDCQYIDCTIYGGATWQGRDNGYVNCDITNFDEGVVIIGAEILGGKHYAENCRFKTSVDPSASSRGIIDVGGNNPAITLNTVTNTTISLTNCTLDGVNLSAITSIVDVEIDGSAIAVNIEIDDIGLNCSDYGQVLLTKVNSGTPSSEYIIVDNVKNKNTITGKLLCNHNANSYLSFPHRLQAQSGREELTTSASSPSVVGAAVVYNWVYPKEPTVFFSRSDRGYFGNRIGVAYGDLNSASGMTPYMSTDDGTNFAAALSFDLSWRAEINEV
jgi:hypothetical protein